MDSMKMKVTRVSHNANGNERAKGESSSNLSNTDPDKSITTTACDLNSSNFNQKIKTSLQKHQIEGTIPGNENDSAFDSDDEFLSTIDLSTPVLKEFRHEIEIIKTGSSNLNATITSDDKLHEKSTNKILQSNEYELYLETMFTDADDHIFEEAINNLKCEERKYNSNTTNIGFHLSPGKSLKICEDAQRKAQNLSTKINNPNENHFKLLASEKSCSKFEKPYQLRPLSENVPHDHDGERIKIPEDAREKAQNVFTDLHTLENHCDYEALTNVMLKSAKLESIKDGEENSMEILGPKANTGYIFSNFGFQTAAGKKITISEVSSSQTEKLFVDIDNISTQNFIESAPSLSTNEKKLDIKIRNNQNSENLMPTSQEDTYKTTYSLFQRALSFLPSSSSLHFSDSIYKNRLSSSSKRKRDQYEN